MKSLELQLKNLGHSITPPRKIILDWIDRHQGIFSAADILEKHPRLDKVTVYRNLQLLESIDAIDPVIVREGAQYYEVHDHDKHHHHIVCTDCEKAECIPCDFNPTLKNYTSVHHTVAMTGVCANCIN